MILGPTNHKTIGVPNYSNEGYAVAPDTDFENIQTVAYVQPTGATTAGSIEFYVETTNKPVVILIYNYDYTSNYWTKLGFRDGDNGSIAAAAGSKSLDNRYVKRNATYNLSTLVASVSVTPDDGYMCKWYMSNAAGDAPTGDPLPATGIQVGNVDNFNLFANFEEDPSKWVDISFAANDNSSLSGIVSFHLRKGSATNSITFPTVIPATGFHHESNTWLDSNGNPLGNTF